MPAPLSALDLRRQDAVERYLAGDPIEAICRELGCSTSWLYKWKNRYKATEPDWFQERSRRPGTTPSKTPEAVEREIVRLRDTLSPGESGSVSAQVIRDHLSRHQVESMPSRRTIYRILRDWGLTRGRCPQRGRSEVSVLSHAWALVLVEVARYLSGPFKEAVV
jgi:transposase-like protein